MKYSGQKLVVLAGLVILVCALCGCEKREETIETVSLNLSVSDDSIVDTSDMSEENVVSDDSEDLPTDSLSSDKAVQWENVYPKDEELAYTKVLKSELPFIDTGCNGEWMFINNGEMESTDNESEVYGFSAVDLNGDGKIEIILWRKGDRNLIFHFMNEKVYGYPVYYREMYEIKENGYFLNNAFGMEGAGIFYITEFDEKNIHRSVYACSCYVIHQTETGSEGEYKYFKDGYPPEETGKFFSDYRGLDETESIGKQISKDEFEEIWNIFSNQWENVEVYDFTDENIYRFFGAAD